MPGGKEGSNSMLDAGRRMADGGWDKQADNRLPSAFSLVELLVIITIIGVLLALLLSAVQAAREAARRAQCTNNLKQIGLACLAHEQQQGFLPTGGWSCCWAGEPTRGFGRRQPGGWHYNVLPFMELQSLHDLSIDQGLNGNRPGLARCMSTPVAAFICPSRRAAIAFPFPMRTSLIFANVPASIQPTVIARTDYAASGGDSYYWQAHQVRYTPEPSSLAQGDSWTESDWKNLICGYYTTGIVYSRSVIRMADIKDGACNTYLGGEKYINPDDYLTGRDSSDNFTWDAGWANDNVRWSGRQLHPEPNSACDTYSEMFPMQDTSGRRMCLNFGSPHASSFNMAFCDGSVRAISYSIDPETHRRLGNIADGLPIDQKAF